MLTTIKNIEIRHHYQLAFPSLRIKFINLMNHEEDTRIIERQIGEESGIKKGIEIGKIQGIEMGSRKMIKSMHNSKLSIKKICEITKMTEKEIMSILNIKSN